MKDKYYEMYVNGRYTHEKLEPVICERCGFPVFNWFYKRVDNGEFKHIQTYIIIDISLPEGKNGKGNQVKVDKREDLVCENCKKLDNNREGGVLVYEW